MKIIALFITLVTTSGALVPPTPNGDSGSQFDARDNEQQLTNPDSEPPYIDQSTSASIEKSRVLSGIGPQEADDRHFDWDEPCTDEQHRKKILTAFTVVQELTKSASERLQDLKDKLPEATGSSINDKNRKFIAATNFAYTQMFRAWDWRIGEVKESFDKLTNNVKNFPHRDEPNKAALRFNLWREQPSLGRKRISYVRVSCTPMSLGNCSILTVSQREQERAS